MGTGRLIPLAIAIAVALAGACAPTAAQAFEFSAPAGSILEGKRSGPDHFVLAGIEEECEEGSFDGAFHRQTLELVPLFNECVAKELGGLYSTFILNGCAYLVRAEGRATRGGGWKADVDLTCRTTYSLRWQVYEETNGREPMCTTLMHPQTGIGTAALTNMPGHPGEITIRWNLDELEFEAYGSALLCGIPEDLTEPGPSYTGYSSVRAVDPRGRPTNLEVVE